MPRIDDYKHAFEIAREEIAGMDPERVAERSGARFGTRPDGTIALTLDFLGKEVRIPWLGLQAYVEGTEAELPLQQEILLLHYLRGVGDTQPREEWISYQEIPDGRFYLDAFLRRAKIPMVQTFGERPGDLLRTAAALYKATPLDQGDHGVLVQALPQVPVGLVLWEGDDEFPPEGNLLFDRSIVEIFSAEDIAWLSGMIVYPMIGMAQTLSRRP